MDNNDLPSYELKELDQDIKGFFHTDIKRRYLHSLPTLMQIERHLRSLIKNGINSQYGSCNSKNAKNNI